MYRWIVLDCNYLCHRAKYVSKKEDDIYSMPYHFFTSVSYFIGKFNPHAVVFCWDSSYSKRRKIYPDYKGQRKTKTEEEKKERELFDELVVHIRNNLPKMGFKNILQKKGYEADDLIASVCLKKPKSVEAIIITADQDMYQLIRHDVSIYEPKLHKCLTLQSFYKRYNILPKQWWYVKALAGCSSDNIKGIDGVGDKTAIAYIRKKLKKTSKKYEKIEAQRVSYIRSNKKLVKLPFKGTPLFKIKKDKMLKTNWLTKYIEKI